MSLAARARLVACAAVAMAATCGLVAAPALPPALPPGHPDIGVGADGPSEPYLPPGHPDIGVGADGPSEPGGGLDARPYTVAADERLEAGVVEVQVLEADGRPAPGAPLELRLRRSDAPGAGVPQSMAARADGQGRHRFAGIPAGSVRAAVVATQSGPAVFATRPFALDPRRGSRVLLRRYPATGDLDEARIAVEATVALSFEDEAVGVEHFLRIYNMGATAFVPQGLVLGLPEGARDFSAGMTRGPAGAELVAGLDVRLVGTFAPGPTDLSYGYRLPLAGETEQRLRLVLPPRVAAARVQAVAGPGIGLAVQGFPAAEQQQAEGGRLLVTERQGLRGSDGPEALLVTLTGLPAPGSARWIALGLAVALTVVAGHRVYQHRGRTGPSEEQMADLVQAREALLGEIVRLEKLRQAGEIGPRSHERLRDELLGALGRIVTELDLARPQKAGASGARSTRPRTRRRKAHR
ncbi:MAG: hypothetical protein HY744_14225 [Deltaproteobacteria bacterium]|nr:hypothetical protein [Deltaproteobacteria bacterium]